MTLDKKAKKTTKETPQAATNVETAADSSVPAEAAKVPNKIPKAAKTVAPKAASTGKVTKAVKASPPAKAPRAAGKAKVSQAKKTATKPKEPAKSKLKSDKQETAEVLDSQVAFEGPLFRVLREHIIEPGGRESNRDVIRHNGSVVILAVDPAKRKKDPWIVIERQYRHAARQFLWELPAGKLDAGEAPVDGAKRELAEETGYSAKKWSPLVEYFASPGFLGEAMKVFLAEGLLAGDAHPEADEHIDFRLVKLSDLLEMVDKGKIIDGKTLTTVLLYARQLGLKRKK